MKSKPFTSTKQRNLVIMFMFTLVRSLELFIRKIVYILIITSPGLTFLCLGILFSSIEPPPPDAKFISMMQYIAESDIPIILSWIGVILLLVPLVFSILKFFICSLKKKMHHRTKERQ